LALAEPGNREGSFRNQEPFLNICFDGLGILGIQQFFNLYPLVSAYASAGVYKREAHLGMQFISSNVAPQHLECRMEL
jgi:hypothetical protein